MAVHELMNYKNWVVCGDVTNERKYAHMILNALRDNGYQAEGYHPKAKEGSGVYQDLESFPFKPEVLDLVVNPVTGIEVVRAAKEAGIFRIMAQPGARSEEIRQFCLDHGMEYVESCVLVELGR